jgi:hypothetical protein
MTIDAPSRPKIIETVVEMGKLMLLKMFRRNTLVIITAKNMTVISEKEYRSGRKIPFLANSIILPEKVTPNNIPIPAAPNIDQVGINFDFNKV